MHVATPRRFIFRGHFLMLGLPRGDYFFDQVFLLFLLFLLGLHRHDHFFAVVAIVVFWDPQIFISELNPAQFVQPGRDPVSLRF